MVQGPDQVYRARGHGMMMRARRAKWPQFVGSSRESTGSKQKRKEKKDGEKVDEQVRERWKERRNGRRETGNGLRKNNDTTTHRTQFINLFL